MDYLNTPYSLIYKCREDLKDFGVQTPRTINYLLFIRLKQQALMGVSGAREVALRCYNNAYYVCTLILLEAKDFPELRISDYVDKILEIEKDKEHIDEVCLASMAMACLLLATYDPKRYGKDSDIWKAIDYRCTHYQWYQSAATDIFHNMMSGEYGNPSPIPRTEFAPRDIVEAIREKSKTLGVKDVEAHLYVNNKEYICERLDRLDDPQRRMCGADSIISRLGSYHKISCAKRGYHPKTKERLGFGPIGNNPKSDIMFWNEMYLIEDTIDYFIERYPKTSENTSEENTADNSMLPETRIHQANTKEQESNLTVQDNLLTEANDNNAQQSTRIQELEKEVQELKETILEFQARADCMSKKKEKRGGIQIGLTPEQCIIFGKYIADKLGITCKNKKNLAPLLNALFGWGTTSLSNKICEGEQKEDKKHVADIFAHYSHDIAKVIYPDWDASMLTPWQDFQKKE